MIPIAIIRSQEIDENYDEVEFEFSATGLPKMDWLYRLNYTNK